MRDAFIPRLLVVGTLAAILCPPVADAVPAISTTEREALIALYNGTDGPNWGYSDNWRNPGDTDFNDPGTECTWRGVTCDGTGTSVIGISLNSNSLSGKIPSALLDLTNLVDLDLGNNNLTGEIPPWIDGLSDLQTLNLGSNPMYGSIPPEFGNLASLLVLDLRCELTGSIPPDLGDLLNLTHLYLGYNEFSGGIPSELGSLTNLQILDLGSAGLSGEIPPEIGGLTSLEYLDIARNHLGGEIPPEFGDLSSLQTLYMDANMFCGVVPPEIKSLTSLSDGFNQFVYNALHSTDQTVIDFLNAKQKYSDWQSTQTVAPENVVDGAVGNETVWLSWTAVTYQDDPGGYEVFSAPSGTGVWTSGGWTQTKTETTFPVTGLAPGSTYDFVVKTRTDKHPQNPNLVVSDPSGIVVQTTASTGCSAPVINLTKAGVTTLSVPGSYDSYTWNTGETDSSIVIGDTKAAAEPKGDRWYWVTVTNAGSCEESATKFVAGDSILIDNFESGNTSIWSATVGGS